MSWRFTAVLGALLAVALAVYLLSPGPGGRPPEDPRLLPSVSPETLVRLEIARRGEPAVLLERGRDAVGEHWKASGVVVDDPAMREMVAALGRFRSTGALDPGSPQAAPAVTGLEAPRLTLTFHTTAGRDTLRFGKAPPTNTTAVFFAKDGDPRVFLAEQAAVAPFDKSVSQLREKRLLRFAPHAVGRFVLRHAFTVARGKDPKAVETEIEESVVERVVEGSERGWFLVKPHREKLDDLRVQRLITELASTPVAEYRTAGDPKAQGLEPPQVEVELQPAGGAPLVVRFGATADGGVRRVAQASGVPDWALVEERRFEDLPTQRKHLRSVQIFPFSKEQVKVFQVRAAGAGRLRLERRETKREGDPLPSVSWELVEPAGVRINREKMEPFVDSILMQRIGDFLGPVEDLKLLKLDPPDAEVEVELKDGGRRLYRFGATSNAAYLQRDGAAEVFALRERNLVLLLRRLELSLLHEEIYNVPITALREIAFEARVPGALEPVFYVLRRTSGGKGWEFADAKNAKSAPSPAWAQQLAVMLNFIKADGSEFAGRDEETVARLGLGDGQAPARLRLKADAEPREIELLISDNRSERAGEKLYYARIKGSPVVFKLGATLVEALKDVRLDAPR